MPERTQEQGAPAEAGRAAQRPGQQQPSRRRVPPQFAAAPPAGRAPGKAADPAAAAAQGALRPARTVARPAQAPAAPRRLAPQPAQAPSGTPPASGAAAARPARGRAAGSRASQKMPFLLLVCGLLGGAMASALGISTALDRGSFRIAELQQQDSQLTRNSLELQDQVGRARSSTVIEQQAYDLGMRPVGLIRELNLTSGQIETGGGNAAGGHP
jgi:hypothetical protein